MAVNIIGILSGVLWLLILIRCRVFLGEISRYFARRLTVYYLDFNLDVSKCFRQFSPTLYQRNKLIILPGRLSSVNILDILSVVSRQIFLHILSRVSRWISSICWRTSFGKVITIFCWTLQDKYCRYFVSRFKVNILDMLSRSSQLSGSKATLELIG